LGFKHRFVAFTECILKCGVDGELRDCHVGSELDVLSPLLSLGFEDVLAFDFSVLDFLFKSIGQRQRAELEENNLVPCGSFDFLNKIFLHFLLDDGAIGEEVI
jgi:hypothetical protein